MLLGFQPQKSAAPEAHDNVESKGFERRYIDYRLRTQLTLTTYANAVGLIIYSIVTAILDPLMGRPEAQFSLHLLRAFSIVGCLVFFALRRRAPHLGRLAIAAVHMLLVCGYAHMMRLHLIEGELIRLSVPATSTMLQMFFLIIMSPFADVGTFIQAVAYLGVVVYASSPNFEEAWRLIVIAGWLNLFAFTFHRTLIAATFRMARAELAGRLKMAPHDLVRRSIMEAADISESLAPRNQWCICLASDWRGYQAICRERTPEEVVTALESYYARCRGLLREYFPAGNYYSDWIADELLIFFQPENLGHEGPDTRLIASVLEFARALVAAKNEHLALVGLPRAIDIGIAAGPAVIGLSGPGSNRKVMAIGAVPVTARKLQSLGKGLRKTFGEKDRIIYQAAMTSALANFPGAQPIAESLCAALPAVLRTEPLLCEENIDAVKSAEPAA